jgi:hypothetical protein
VPRLQKNLATHPELGLPEVRKLWQTEGLFSDHYLKARLQNNSWWPSDAEAEPIWRFCKELYEKRYLACAKNNETFTRQELLDKILEKLGFAWTDNLGLPDQDAEPDYILFSSAEEKEKMIKAGKQERYAASVGILEAKKVNHPLSQISKHQRRYPHQQIRDYLNEAQVLTWSILTNGNEWRLYARDAKPSQFFGLNFEIAIQSLADFKVFLVLFSAAAFARDAQGKCRLDQIREAALATQAELEADLRARIFTVVEILANGFAERPENNITDADLPRLYENCLIYLYRLLFILYAEGRLLLPVEPKSRKYYKQLSLARLLTPLKNYSEYDSQTQTRFYRDIHALSLVINGSDKKANDEFGVPRYNGGLFDPYRYPLLQQWAVSDAVLAEVLRQIMFTPEKSGQKFVPFESVDYADLSVQQLGSIYEGLLEHHFVRENGKIKLQTDKGERKATGTYYTPDYIVKYIVEKTLGPLLAEIEQRADVKAGKENAFAGEVLKLNICDPAMGSGHFLVEATIYLADHIVYHPTTRFQAEFSKGVSQEETEMAYWRRRVVESCIYGVDLNPLAVELAKLSLWLTTISSDQPLNFLDHHLHCGNSLVGAKLDDLGDLLETRKWVLKEVAQARLVLGLNLKQAVSNAIQTIHKIEDEPSDSVGAVKGKEFRWQRDVLPALAPYKAIADLWTATWFGFALDQETYTASANRILRVGYTDDFTRLVERDDSPGDKLTEWRDIAASRRFFHWELEFPEAFFNDDGSPKENPGFDVVIGNPPYGKLPRDDRNFLVSTYKTATGAPDLFALFIERGTTQLQASGKFGFIIPSGWLTAREYIGLRDFVLGHLTPVNIVHLPYDVFPDAYIDCITWIAWKCRPSPKDTCYVRRYGVRERIARMPQATSEFKAVPLAAWISDPAKAMVTEMGAGQWLRQWRESDRFVSLGILLRVSRGITPYEESGPDDSRKKALGFFGSLGRYHLEAEKFAEVVFDPSLMEYKPPEFFKGKRFIVRRIISRQRRIHATIVSDDFVINKSYLVALKNSPDYAPEYLLAILNSKLISLACVSRSEIAKRDDFPQLDIATVQEFPIRRIAFTTTPMERKRLMTMAAKLYECSIATNDAAEALEFVEAQLHEKRSDVIHDLLSYLGEQMMVLNKEKEYTAKTFLTDIKEFYGIEARSLTPKTKLDEFWKLETAELFAHLHANKIKFKEFDEEKIRSRFLKAKAKLVPLDSQINFTDTLIDQIVYRLYGLTEDEIKIVEGTSR